MATLCFSPEVPRGEFVISKQAEDGYYAVLECTIDLAYAWFGSGVLRTLRLNGDHAAILINQQDWEENYWRIPKPEENDDEES